MRLWHEALIPHLPQQQLQGQHRECCALRGKGWGRKHKDVDYVFTHSISRLYDYHVKVMDELIRRNPAFNLDYKWVDPSYRGKVLGYDKSVLERKYDGFTYNEHNDEYLSECLENLANKGHSLVVSI